MNKFNQSALVVWKNELCKILVVARSVCVVKNFHREKVMTIEKSDLRNPKQGEFLDSSSLNGSEESNGPTILTKSKGG